MCVRNVKLCDNTAGDTLYWVFTVFWIIRCLCSKQSKICSCSTHYIRHCCWFIISKYWTSDCAVGSRRLTASAMALPCKACLSEKIQAFSRPNWGNLIPGVCVCVCVCVLQLAVFRQMADFYCMLTESCCSFAHSYSTHLPHQFSPACRCTRVGSASVVFSVAVQRKVWGLRLTFIFCLCTWLSVLFVYYKVIYSH